MSNITGALKGGLHPKAKDGGTESWRGDHKSINQVAGWVGKGKPAHPSRSSDSHASRPLASLKDPAAFGPPPKNVNFHGGPALPNETTLGRRGTNASLSTAEVITIRATPQVRATEPGVETSSESAASFLPRRSGRTGLKVDHILPPPTNSLDELKANLGKGPVMAPVNPSSKPSLPPRLPPRNISSGLKYPEASASPAYESQCQSTESPGINQNAISRLGKAGISVPGLGIRPRGNIAPSPEQTPSTTRPPPHLSNLQSQFSGMNIVPSPTARPPESQSRDQGTTLAEKQAAFKTAQSFHKDPGSTSLADAQSAASTANNFRNRHGHEIASGAQKANSWNSKYNISGRANGFLGGGTANANNQDHNIPPSPDPNHINPQSPPMLPPKRASQDSLIMPSSNARKPPPPPPQKRSLTANHVQTNVTASQQKPPPPPPIPLGTKPSRTNSNVGWLPVSNEHHHESSGGDGGGGGFGG